MSDVTFKPETDALELVLNALEPGDSLAVNDLIIDALRLACAVGVLLDFGGGNLKLPDGRVFKLARTCDACKNAVRMFTRAGLESKFCVRCANRLAELEWARCIRLK